jgi:ribosomal protein L7/L12
MDRQLSDDQIEQLQREFQANGKIAAVKLYKEWTDSSLVEAKQSVENLITSRFNVGQGAPSDFDEKGMDAVLDAIQKGNKLEAVKLYKTSSGASLMDAKQFIERLMSELGVEDKPRSGCAGVLLAIMVVAFGAALSVA